MRKFLQQFHTMPVSSAGWESFQGTGAIFFACLGTWVVLGAAYSRLF